jgi:2-polyprenyl-6-hydroxyphenyl methylase / 3-demethylubiquinone-9 3-methyltransferase
MATKQVAPTTVYYNSACPVCDAGVKARRRRSSLRDVEWVDVHHHPDAVGALGVPVEAVRERLHVVSREQLFVGASAVAVLLRGAPEHSPRAPAAGPSRGRQWVRAAMNWAYDRFARALYRWNLRQGRWTPNVAVAANQDPAELAKFAALAERWWNEDSEFRPLHRMNPVRLSWINSLVPLRGQRVLDVGCGGGILAEAMARQGGLVTGIDLAEAPLAVARLHAARGGVGVDYRACSAETLALHEPQVYDVVTCMEMLEHVPRPEEVVAACARLVRPGGWVIFSTINRSLASWLLAIVGAEYVLRLLPRGTHRWDRFIRPSELLAAAHGHGLVLREQRGLAYNPLTQRFRLYGYLGVGYLLAVQRPLHTAATPQEALTPRAGPLA